MKRAIVRVFEEILAEIEANEAFRSRLEAILAEGTRPGSPAVAKRVARSRNRRAPAVLDPYREYARGEVHLRGRLEQLSVDQLKDIVSEHAMDSSRLALKWRKPDRLVELIVTTVRGRLEKGNAFRQ